MKHVSVLGVLVVGSSLLSACARQTANEVETQTPTKAAIEEKQGDTTKTGVISGSEGSYVLTVRGQAPIGLDSYAVDLASYVGQTVTVTGQYSGDTLFVGAVE